MSKTLFIVAALTCVVCPAAAGGIGGRCMLPGLGLALGTVNSLSATPGTISFSASNPDSGAVSGSSQATLNWSIQNGVALLGWSISVQSGASTFSGCSTVPVSAVSVTCTNVSVGGLAGTGACNGTFPLSTVAHQVAGGTQALGTQSYSVQINYTLAESWRYVANPSCALTLTYTVTAI